MDADADAHLAGGMVDYRGVRVSFRSLYLLQITKVRYFLLLSFDPYPVPRTPPLLPSSPVVRSSADMWLKVLRR